MNTILRCILIFIGFSFISDAQAQRAKDGSYTVTGAAEVLNTYTNLTVNATAGATSISVGNNAMTGGAFGATPLQQGDLVLIVQMHGASVDVNFFPVISGWGDYTWPQSYFDSGFGVTPETFGQVTNYNNAGRYERLEVLSTPGGGTINFTCGLTYNYTAAGEVQIVRIPRLDDLTVNGGAAVVPNIWNGTTGGVVALEVNGTLTLNAGGTITASGYGFRGGQVDNDFTPGAATTSPPSQDRFLGSPSGFEGSEKGEGIGGYHIEYDLIYSRYGVSGIANGGGGGGFVNAGGGGGSNAEVGAGAFNARGNPVPGYAAAYGQDPNITASSGAGKGGYCLSQSNQNASFTGPNQAAWGGDARKSNGGWGGHPLTYDAGRIFFGGGGGAGDQDSGEGGDGGRGGGIVYIVNYGTVAGSGAIEANGGSGENSNPTNQPLGFNAFVGNDGAGGGGGAGTVYIENATAIPGTVSIDAIGGDGGNQNLQVNAFQQNEAGGPGGSGSGGIIRYSSGAPATNITSGTAGTTTSTQLTEFPPNGATNGSAGDALVTAPYYDLIPNDVTICAGQMAAPSVTVNGSYTGTLNWYTVQYGGSPIAGQTNQLTYNVSPGTTTTYWVGVCPGTFRVPVVVTVLASPNLVVTDPPAVCAPNTVDITLPAVTAGSDAGTLTYWQNMGATIALGTPTAVGAGTYYIQLDIGGGCTVVEPITVTVNPLDDASFTSGDYCESSTNTISGVTTPGGTFSIQSQTGSGGVTIAGGTGILSNGVAGDQVTIEYTTTGPCPNTSTQVVNVLPDDDASFTTGDFCVSAVNTISGVVTPGGTFSIVSQTGSGGVTIAPVTGILSNYFAGDQVTIQYTTPAGPCQGSSTQVVNVTNLDDATFVSNNFCASGVNTISGVITPGGTFSITGQTGSGGVTIAPGTGILSNYFAGDQVTIQYTTPAGGCQNSSTQVVNVLNLDDASFTSADYCVGGSNTISGVATLGGTFTIQSQTGSGTVTIAAGTGILSGGIAGDQITIEYTTPVGACPNSSTQVVNILPLDDATFVTNDFCASSVNIIAGVVTPGGTFSIVSQTGSGGVTIAGGTGILSNYFAGDQVTIQYTTPGPCPNTSTQVVNVTNLDDASFTSGDFCVSGVNTISGVATPGGTFTIQSQTGSGGVTIAPGTGILSNYFAGDQVTIEYTTPAGGCQNSSTVVVNVLNLDDASFTSSDYCLGGSNTISAVATPGGTFAIQSQTGSGTVTITPGTGILSNGVAGDQVTIEYTTTGPCPNTSTQVVNILPLDDASFTSGDFCVSSVNTISGVATPGGTFSITSQTGSGGVTIAPGTGILSNYFAGDQVTIQYTTTGPCPNSSTQVVNITSLDDASFTTGDFCASSVNTVLGIVTAGGTFSIQSQTGSGGVTIAPGTGILSNYFAGDQVTIEYITPAGGCQNASTVIVNVLAPDDATFNYSAAAYCVDATDPTPTITGLTGGTFSSTAGLAITAGTGEIDVSASTAGIYTVTYTTNGPCPNSSDVSVTINDLPVISAVSPVAICAPNDAILDATAPGTGYIFEFFDPSLTSLGAGTVVGNNSTLAVAGLTVGSYNYNVTITDPLTGCSSSATIVVNVTAQDDASFSYAAAAYCQEGADPTPTITGLVGGSFSSTAGLSIAPGTGDIDVSASTPGTYTVTYTTTGPCPNSSDVSVTINATPTISGPTAVCPGANAVLTGSGTPDGTTPWTSSNMGVATVDNAGVVTGIIAGSTTITYLDANGCSNTYVVLVSAAPVLDPVPNATACDSIQLGVIGGTGLTGNEAYYSGMGGTGTQYAAGDWVSSSMTVYVNDISNPCTIEQSFTITVNTSPTISGGTAVCESSVLALLGTGTPDPVTPWSSSNTGVATVDNAGNVTGVAAGTADITYTDINGCSNTETITVNATPTISGNAPICAAATNTLTGSGTPDATTPWTSSDPAVATIDNAGLVTAVAAGVTTITYLDANGCSTTEVVTVNAAPNLVITDPAAVCDPLTVDVTDVAVTAGSDPGTLTYWTDNLATITLASPTTVNTTNTYYIQLDDGNCTTIQPVSVTVNPMPTITLTDPAAVCDPALVDLTDAAVTAGSAPGTFTYFDGMGTAVPTPTAVGSGTYFITLTDGNGCQSAGQVTATVNPTPNVVVTDPSPVCEPNTVDLTATNIAAGSDPGTLTYWTDAGATVTLSTPAGVLTGMYYIQLEDGNGCATIASVNAIVDPLDDASFFLTPTCDGATATLTGTTGGTFSLLTVSSATIDPFTGTVTGASYNEALDIEYATTGICPNNSVELVIVDDCTPDDLIIPTAFTPGSDGAHDTWEIVGLDNVYPNSRVTVYNRWGNKVFEHNASSSNPYSNNMWDGTFNGAQLPVASYYYIIETNDASSTEKYEGTVTILQ